MTIRANMRMAALCLRTCARVHDIIRTGYRKTTEVISLDGNLSRNVFDHDRANFMMMRKPTHLRILLCSLTIVVATALAGAQRPASPPAPYRAASKRRAHRDDARRSVRDDWHTAKRDPLLRPWQQPAAGRAELRLVVKAGSVLEDDDQRGLAHFVEHIAFDGTAHFPKQDIIGFMQSLGMKFGAHVNAYTSFDETVFMLQVPTDNLDVLDRSL